MTRFLLVRHATNDTVGKLLAGRMQGIHLNEEGRAQAQMLSGRLAHLPITAIYASSLERAIETAEPLAHQLQQEIKICDDFLELECGEWTNCTFEALAAERSFQLFNTFRSVTRIPGGESMLEAQARMISGIQKLCLQHPGGTVVVVSHSDPIKAAIAYYAGIPLDLFQRLEISPASVSVLDIYAETVRILLLNYTGEIMF